MVEINWEHRFPQDLIYRQKKESIDCERIWMLQLLKAFGLFMRVKDTLHVMLSHSWQYIHIPRKCSNRPEKKTEVQESQTENYFHERRGFIWHCKQFLILAWVHDLMETNLQQEIIL